MKNPYGILNSDGSIVFVDDVERGLACNCVCPLCHKEFRACHGEKNQHYFAHQDASECEFSYRASLLRMVVDYLQTGEIEIPAVIAEYMSKYEVLSKSEMVSFERVEQQGDIKNPELHCYLGSRSWVLRPVFDAKEKDWENDAHLTLDLSKFSNPYESRPDRTLAAALRTKRLLKWKNYPGLKERENALKAEHQASQRIVNIHSFRGTHSRSMPLHPRPVRRQSEPKPTFSFNESPLPCKFCKKTIQPTDAVMTARSEGYCVCRTCNRERGGNIHTSQ